MFIMKNKNLFLIVLLIVIGWLYFAQRSDKEMQEVLQDQDAVEEGVEKEEVEEIKEEISLEAVGSFTGSAVATRSFDNTVFEHEVTATLNDPEEGKFYEGWLVKTDPELTFFSTGKLEKQDGKYSLSYSSAEDKSDFNDVVITSETLELGLDGTPEAHVLEGSFLEI